MSLGLALDQHGRGAAVETSEELQVLVNGRPLGHVDRHSPTGFAWGYGGSGPADLALSILADYLGDLRLAEDLYQSFKSDKVAKWPQDKPWRLTGQEIEEWLESVGVEPTDPRDVVYVGIPAGWRPESGRAAPHA